MHENELVLSVLPPFTQAGPARRRCRFSGGGNSFATSGYVPVGTVITVVCGSEGNLASGYSINGAASTNKGQASFKLTVDADTTIKMQQR